MIKKSIENGVDLNVKDGDGLTPLHLAVQNGIVYDWSKAFFIFCIESEDLEDLEMIDWFIISGLESIVDILLKSNADVNVRDSNGKLPFVLALEKGNFDWCKFYRKEFFNTLMFIQLGHEKIATVIINNANFTLDQSDLDVLGVECNGNHKNFIVWN